MEDFFRDALVIVNPNINNTEWNILAKLDNYDYDYDVLGTTGIEYLLLNGNINDILNAIVMDNIKGRITFSMQEKEENVVALDKATNKIIRLCDCRGSAFIDECIKEMNKILEDGKDKI